MARLRRLVHRGKVFFITTNLRRGLPLFSGAERDLLCRCINTARKRRRFQLPGFVIMPDHVHLLVLPEEKDTISKLVQDLKYTSARTINSERKQKRGLWRKGFFDRFMRTPAEFLETLDYIHQNPVRKGLVTGPVDWRWSSATAYRGSESIIPVDVLDLPAGSQERLW